MDASRDLEGKYNTVATIGRLTSFLLRGGLFFMIVTEKHASAVAKLAIGSGKALKGKRGILGAKGRAFP